MLNISAKNQKGISILFVIFIVSIFLAIAFGLSAILIGQIKMLSEIGHSVKAFYAADSGIERVLMDRQYPNLGGYDGSLDGANYEVFVVEGGTTDCPESYCIKSIGTYLGVKRAIEISY